MKRFLALLIGLAASLTAVVTPSLAQNIGQPRLEIEYWGQSSALIAVPDYLELSAVSLQLSKDGKTISSPCKTLDSATGIKSCGVSSAALVSLIDLDALATSGEISLFAKFLDSESDILDELPVAVVDRRQQVPVLVEMAAYETEFVMGRGSLILNLSAKAQNSRGTIVDSAFVVSLEGETLFQTEGYQGEMNASINLASIGEGSHTFQVSAENAYGRVDNPVTVQVVMPRIEGVVIDAPPVFYPFVDKHLDTLKFQVRAITNVDAPITGVVTVRDSSGATVYTKKLNSSQRTDVTVSGTYKKKLLAGKLAISASYNFKGQPSVSISKTTLASPKRMVETKGSVTVNAWQAKVTCGKSFKPCSRGGYNDSSNGIELYSDPIGEISHSSRFQIKVPTGTYKWQVRANGLRTSLIVAQFGAFSDFGKNIGWLPSRKMYSGSWISGWAYGDAQGSAGWKLESDDYGSIWVESFTVNWVARTLK